jgi:translation initiation factor IF-3
VRLIGSDGEKIGVVTIEQALALAQEAQADLVEVAPAAAPPVCRIMDYKKLLYEKQRKEKEARKNQRHVETKEVKLRPSIDEHDYQTKLNHLRGFLLKGHKAKITLIFRERELRRYDVGAAVVDRMIAAVGDIATVEPGGRKQRRTIIVLLNPKKEIQAKAEQEFKEEILHRKREHDRKLAEKGSNPNADSESPEPDNEGAPPEMGGAEFAAAESPSPVS